MNTTEISNLADVIDSRTIDQRIKELEKLRDEAQEQAKEPDSSPEAITLENGTELFLSDNFTEEEAEELAALESFREDVSSSEWKYGLTLIHESHFEDYARELAEDIGAIPDDAQWPATCIDWEEAARELKIDYSQADFNGETYYFRS